jgi:hypothetical protein
MDPNPDIKERLPAYAERLRAYDGLLAEERALLQEVLSFSPDERATNDCFRRLLELTQRVTDSGRETMMTALLDCVAQKIDAETAAAVEMAVRQRDAVREETAAMLRTAEMMEQQADLPRQSSWEG